MIHISVYRNTELNSLLIDDEFLHAWKELATQTQGFHVLQEPEFVLTWYRHYRAKYEPVLLIGTDEEGSMVGLMALAWEEENQMLTHAGDYSAEYHGWLATQDYSKEFFIQCLLEIKQLFSFKKWEWNFMPPNISFHLLESEKKKLQEAGIYLIFKEEDSPIWDLKDQTKLAKTLKSSSLRSKRNRLKRQGELRFEHITDRRRAEQTLNLAAKQYDFRKEAQYNIRPFEEDPKVLGFDIDVISQTECLHCCALWLDDKLLACHVGATDGKSLQLGLITFDASAYAYSPGTLLLAELAKHLTEEGYETFDITPAGDAYKKRYANSFVRILKPTVYVRRSEFEKGQLKSRIRNYLHRKDLLTKTKDIGKRLKENPKRFLKARSFLNANKSTDVQLMPVSKDYYTRNDWQGLDIEKQNYSALLSYEGNCSSKNRQQLLLDAYDKFKQAESLYSIKIADDLMAFAWKKILKKETYIGGELLEKGTVIVYDFYFKSHAIRRVAFEEILREIVTEESRDHLIYVLLKKEQTDLLAEALPVLKRELEMA